MGAAAHQLRVQGRERQVNAQIDSLNAILKKYDPTGMLIGEARA